MSGKAKSGKKKQQHSKGLQALSARFGQSQSSANNRIERLLSSGDYAGAEQASKQQLARTPSDRQLQKAYAAALLYQEKLDDALPLCRELVERLPLDWECWANLAFAERSRGDWSASIAAYHKAIELHAGNGHLCASLAQLYRACNDNAQALYWFLEALKAEPSSSRYFLDWAHSLTHLRKSEQAFEALSQAWREEPDNPELAVELFCAARALGEWQLMAEAEAMLLARKQQGVFDWMSPLTYIGWASTTRQDQLAYTRRHVETLLARGFSAKPYQPVSVQITIPPRRLRIGYLSADFHNHATTHLVNGVLLAHEAVGLEMYLYSYGPDDGSERRRELEKAATVFRDIRMSSPEKAAQIIEADGLDILVDMKGWTKDFRPDIQMLRPAPVIVSWLGYPGTLGHPSLADYIIGDPVVTPFTHADGYAEAIAQMPHSYQPNDRRRPLPPTITRAAAGLPDEGFVFCSFNRIDKLNPDVFAVWCRILRAVPGSVLWLLADQAQAQDNLRREAIAQGVAEERLIFAPYAEQTNHLARLGCADLALDTFPYTSHTTGSDALWVGLPLLALQGETFASRVSASLVRAAGLPELVTQNLADYEAQAVNLALQAGTLAQLRARLQANRLSCPLFDSFRFARDLARLYAHIWQQHTEGRRDSFALPAE